MQVHRGGPVETGRGFVLHSSDYYVENSTLPIDEHVSLTTTLEILKAIAAGNGPESALLALGYAGWSPGQLDNEILENGWLHCPARARTDLRSPTSTANTTGRCRLLGVDAGAAVGRGRPRLRQSLAHAGRLIAPCGRTLARCYRGGNRRRHGR